MLARKNQWITRLVFVVLASPLALVLGLWELAEIWRVR